MRLEEMTSKEFAKAMKKGPVIILPFGAMEAHGDHLPLGTDTFQPVAMADALGDRLGALVAPPIWYGQHSSTKKMPGTIGVRMETLKALTIDVLDSLIANGARKIVVISGHAGSVHLAAIKSACEEVVERHQVQLMFLSDYHVAVDLEKEVCGDEPDGHGGNLETSRILALRPELVKKGRKVGKGSDAAFMVQAHPEVLYPNQHVGRADKASKEIGERVNEYIVDQLTEMIKRNFEG